VVIYLCNEDEHYTQTNFSGVVRHCTDIGPPVNQSAKINVCDAVASNRRRVCKQSSPANPFEIKSHINVSRRAVNSRIIKTSRVCTVLRSMQLKSIAKLSQRAILLFAFIAFYYLHGK